MVIANVDAHRDTSGTALVSSAPISMNQDGGDDGLFNALDIIQPWEISGDAPPVVATTDPTPVDPRIAAVPKVRTEKKIPF